MSELIEEWFADKWNFLYNRELFDFEKSAGSFDYYPWGQMWSFTRCERNQIINKNCIDVWLPGFQCVIEDSESLVFLMDYYETNYGIWCVGCVNTMVRLMDKCDWLLVYKRKIVLLENKNVVNLRNCVNNKKYWCRNCISNIIFTVFNDKGDIFDMYDKFE